MASTDATHSSPAIGPSNNSNSSHSSSSHDSRGGSSRNPAVRNASSSSSLSPATVPVSAASSQQQQPQRYRGGASIVDFSVVSFTQYTFVNRERAINGPQPIEPPVESALQTLQPAGVTQTGESLADILTPGHVIPGYAAYAQDDKVRDFSEDRDNRRLAMIAKRLLLPDSYIEACYDLHRFIALHPTLETESVQRNLFKCLKVCARLSKLPGYSIQLMWQVIQQAHGRADQFIPERAATIRTWYFKMTNRIRLMAVSPASDGSAPPRLPLVPPRTLVEMHERDRLLPLPDMNISALNDKEFDKVNGVSSATRYLSNPSTYVPALPPISGDGGNQGPLDSLADITCSISESSTTEAGQTDGQQAQIQTQTQTQTQTQGSSTSTQETELGIIESQLRVLESYPSHRLGPMMRAALNLLVEMRFRLQLGLPRNASTSPSPGTPSQPLAEAPSAGARSIATVQQPNSPIAGGESSFRGDPSPHMSSLVQNFGIAGAIDGRPGSSDEERVIQHVLSQISYSRRRENEGRMMMMASALSRFSGAFGTPLAAVPPAFLRHGALMGRSYTIGSVNSMDDEDDDDGDDRGSVVTDLSQPESTHGQRRRRRSSTGEYSSPPVFQGSHDDNMEDMEGGGAPAFSAADHDDISDDDVSSYPPDHHRARRRREC